MASAISDVIVCVTRLPEELQDRLDYFGQTVNIAARVQSLADSRAIFATKSVVDNSQVSKILEAGKHKLTDVLYKVADPRVVLK